MYDLRNLEIRRTFNGYVIIGQKVNKEGDMKTDRSYVFMEKNIEEMLDCIRKLLTQYLIRGFMPVKYNDETDKEYKDRLEKYLCIPVD